MSKRFQLSWDDMNRWFIHVMQVSGLTMIAMLEQLQQGQTVDMRLLYFGLTFLAIDLIRKRLVHNPDPLVDKRNDV